VNKFKAILKQLGEKPNTGTRRPIFVSIHADAICGTALPGAAIYGSIGLSAEEILDMCFIAGSDPNVTIFLSL
jgi:hypothetical protein